jgi:fructose-6-phosphate aldolase 2
LLKAIRAIIGGKELHVQATESSYEKILEEAAAIVELLGENTFVKIPATPDGLRAVKTLKARGFHITATAILSATQAMLAARAGADYVAPYVNRMDNLGVDGVGAVADLVDVFAADCSATQILAASFKTKKQALDVARVGCHAATINSAVMHELLAHPATDSSVAQFERDWRSAFGESTLLSLLKK